jgi:hypothetical protein
MLVLSLVLALCGFVSPSLPSFVILALEMETACFFKTLASVYETTRHQNPRQHQQGPIIHFGYLVSHFLYLFHNLKSDHLY